VQNAPVNAAELGATGFGMFTKNQRQWTSPRYAGDAVAGFRNALRENGYAPEQVLAHDGYLINLGNPGKEAFERSYAAFVDELKRCSLLGLKLLNIHPGSHLRLVSEEACMLQIAGAVNRAHTETEGVTVVFENTAGQGSNVGWSFGQIGFLIRNVSDKSRVGFCFDTCHAFAAGYDLRTRGAYEKTMKELEAEAGFRYLRGAHLNDAKGELGGRLDRHQSIGMGTIGREPFRFIMQDERFEEIPLVLETVDEKLWPSEVAMLKDMAG
jgi:deoxyribonuclease-4